MAAGGMGSSIAGASKSKGQVLKPKDIARSTLRGYYETAPGYYALNQAYGPGYLGQGAANLEQLLFGTTGSTNTTLVPVLNAKGKVKKYIPQTITTPASRGYLDLMEAAQPTLARLNAAARETDLADMMQLAPEARAAWAEMYPELSGLQTQLGGDASSQLALGGRWSPEVGREVQQNVRSSLAARGLGYGPSDVYSEAMTMGRYGEDLRQQRQNYAMNAMRELAGSSPNFMNWLSQSNNNAGLAANLLGGISPLAYSPTYPPSGAYNPTAASVAMSGQGLNYMQGVNQANMYGALGGGLMGLGSSMFDYYRQQQNP